MEVIFSYRKFEQAYCIFSWYDSYRGGCGHCIMKPQKSTNQDPLSQTEVTCTALELLCWSFLQAVNLMIRTFFFIFFFIFEFLPNYGGHVDIGDLK